MKYPRTYHVPWSPGATKDDKIASDISNVLGRPVVITEKLDGENSAMEKDGVYGRSHEVYTDAPWAAGVRELHASIRSYLMDDDFMLFGENMEGIHSIEYTNLKSYFYLFGVTHTTYHSPDESQIKQFFVDWGVLEFYAEVLELKTVPVFVRDEIFSSEEELKREMERILEEEGSKLGGKDVKTGEPTIEGLVVRPSNGFLQEDFHKNVFKWVRKGHVEEGEEHWTKNWKRAELKK